MRSTLQSGAPSQRILLVWANSIALAFLIVGCFGLWNPAYKISLWMAEGNTPKDVQDEAMGAAVQMQVEQPEEVVPPQPVEQPPVPVVPPPVTPEEPPPEPVEPVTPLKEEAIFPVPATAPLVKALTLEPRPKQSTPRPAAPPPSAAVHSAAPATTGGETGPAQGLRAGSSGSKGHFPAPPYPSFARSRGVQGNVSVAITVDATGTVTGARVLSTSGSAELDEYVCNWVQRHWRWPAGNANTYRQPVAFKLH